MCRNIMKLGTILFYYILWIDILYHSAGSFGRYYISFR